MTRFKELARIERACRDGQDGELRSALSYARSRIQIAPTKSQTKYWSELTSRIEAALGSRGT
jgi:hypothetical protein